MASPLPLTPNVSLPSIHEMFPAHLMRRDHDEQTFRGHRSSPSSNGRCTVAGCVCSSSSTSWSSSSSGSSTVVSEPPHTHAAYAYPQPHPHADAHWRGRRAGARSRSDHAHPHASGPLGLSAPNSSSNRLERESRSRPSAHSDKAVYSFVALRSDPKNASSQHLAASAAYARAHVPSPPRSGPYPPLYMHPSPCTNPNPHHPQDQQNQQSTYGYRYPRPKREHRHSYASAPLPPPPPPHHLRQYHHPHHPHHQHPNPRHEHQYQMETSDADAEEDASNGELDPASMNLNMHQPHPQSPPHFNFGPSHPGYLAHGMSVLGGMGVGVGVGIGVGIETVEGVGIGGALVGKQYVCPTCFKQFNRPSSLRTHIHTHTGATPFRCPWPTCGREFNVNSNMRRHYRHHTARSASLKPSPTSSKSSDSTSLANGPDRSQSSVTTRPGPITTHPAIPPVLWGGVHGADGARARGYTTGTRLGLGDNDRQGPGPHAQGQMKLEDGRRKRRRTEGDLGTWEEERTSWATLNPNKFQRGYVASRLKREGRGEALVSDGEEEEVDELDDSDSERDLDREGRGGEKNSEREEMDVEVDTECGMPPPYVERSERTDIVRLRPKARSHPYACAYAPNPLRRDLEQVYPSSQSNPSFSSCALSNLGTPYPGQHTHSPVYSPASSPPASHASLPHSHSTHSQRAFHKPSSHPRSRYEHSPSASPSPSPSLSPALSAFGVPSSHSCASSPSSSTSLTPPSEAGDSIYRGKAETVVERAAEARVVTKPRYSLSTPYSRSLADTRVSTILRPAFAHASGSASGNGSGNR